MAIPKNNRTNVTPTSGQPKSPPLVQAQEMVAGMVRSEKDAYWLGVRMENFLRVYEPQIETVSLKDVCGYLESVMRKGQADWQVHESTVVNAVMRAANALTDGDGEPVAWPVFLAGDKGYRADWIDESLLALQIIPVIPSKENEDRAARPVDFEPERSRQRNIDEAISSDPSAANSRVAGRDRR